MEMKTKRPRRGLEKLQWMSAFSMYHQQMLITFPAPFDLRNFIEAEIYSMPQFNQRKEKRKRVEET